MSGYRDIGTILHDCDFFPLACCLVVLVYAVVVYAIDGDYLGVGIILVSSFVGVIWCDQIARDTKATSINWAVSAGCCLGLFGVFIYWAVRKIQLYGVTIE